MNSTLPATHSRLQVSLGASNLARSVAYYRVLFGTDPVEHDDQVARFELADPPAEFKLTSRAVAPGGAMNHLGLRLTDDEAVGKAQGRLEAAGIATRVELNTLCGYARQNKVWSTDPDGHAWEVYTVREDVSPADMPCGAGCGSSNAEKSGANAKHAWQPTPTDSAKLHFGLGVTNLRRSVEFYRELLGVEPAKNFADYAKFEFADPPLMFSLGQHPPSSGGALNQVLLRLPATKFSALVKRLATMRTEATRVGANVRSVDVVDPDGVTWRFTLDSGESCSDSAIEGEATVAYTFARQEAAIWSHRLGETFPATIPLADACVTEVRLSGSFNAHQAEADMERLLGEVHRVLAPGGKIVVTGLMADRPFPGAVKFPAPAAQLERVPEQSEPELALRRAGFFEPHFEKLSPVHCLDGRGVELFSMVLVARR